jgi:hypothetical protein
MSQWTYVRGNFIIRFATEYFDEDEEVDAGFMKEPHDIYEVMIKAPRITGGEHDCIYSVDITDQAPYKSIDEDDFIYYEAKITIRGHLRDREFEETDQEVRDFIKYLKEETGYETKFVEGKIEVSNRPFINLCWGDDEDYKIQSYDLGEKNEKDN